MKIIPRYNVILTIYLLPRGGYKHSKKVNTLRVELALTWDHCCHHFRDIVEVVKVQAGLVGRNEVVLNVDIETDKAAGQ